MKNATNTRDALLIEELRKNGVKLFLLSTDSTSENITDLNSLKLFHNYRQPLNVTGLTDRQVEDSLKSCLKQLVEKRMQDPSQVHKDDLSTTNVGRLATTPKMKTAKNTAKSSNTNKSGLSGGNLNTLVDFFDQD